MESAAQAQSAVPVKKTGVMRRGWALTKSSWHVWRLDKELTALPLISFLVSLVVIIPFIAIFLLTSDLSATKESLQSSSGAQLQSTLAGWQQAGLVLIVMFLSTLIANFFSGAVIYGAVQRFRGGDPTVRTSLSGAARKFRPLILFSLMMTTVGFILQFLEERLPLAGRIATYLFDAAWNIANIFAIPVIVLSEESISPLQATRKSVEIIKKVWGEGIIVNIGIGLIGALSFMIYALTVLLAAGLVYGATGAVSAPLFVVGAVGITGAIGLMLIFSTLSAIAKAALYQYAVTGEAPASFNKELLRSSMTHKKASKIFK